LKPTQKKMSREDAKSALRTAERLLVDFAKAREGDAHKGTLDPADQRALHDFALTLELTAGRTKLACVKCANEAHWRNGDPDREKLTWLEPIQDDADALLEVRVARMVTQLTDMQAQLSEAFRRRRIDNAPCACCCCETLASSLAQTKARETEIVAHLRELQEMLKDSLSVVQRGVSALLLLREKTSK
jgi:hypothetical protein